MTKSWTPLEEVRLFWDKKTDTVKVTSSDPRLGGESFVLRLSRNTRADELAREVLAEAGVNIVSNEDIPAPIPHVAAPLLAEELLNRPVLTKQGYEPGKIIFGYDHNLDPQGSQKVTLNYPNLDGNQSVTVGIFGNIGQGKTILVNQILPQLAQDENLDEVYFVSSGYEHVTLVPGGVKHLTDLARLDLTQMDANKKRAIVIDGHRTDSHAVQAVMRTARSMRALVIVTDHFVKPEILNLLHSVVVIGSIDLRQRIMLGIDQFGILPRGTGILIEDIAGFEMTRTSTSDQPHRHLFQTYRDVLAPQEDLPTKRTPE